MWETETHGPKRPHSVSPNQHGKLVEGEELRRSPRGQQLILRTNSAAVGKALASAVLRRRHSNDQVIHPSRHIHRGLETREVPSYRSHESAQRTARGLLTKLTGNKTEYVPIDHDAAHILITPAATRRGGAAIDQGVDPCQSLSAVLPSGRHRPPHRTQLPVAAGPER